MGSPSGGSISPGDVEKPHSVPGYTPRHSPVPSAEFQGPWSPALLPLSAIAVVTGPWPSPSLCQPRQPGADGGGREPGRAQLALLPGPLSCPLPLPHPCPGRRPPAAAPLPLCAAGVSVPEAGGRNPQHLGHDSPAVAAAVVSTARLLDG